MKYRELKLVNNIWFPNVNCNRFDTHLLSAESISSTISQRTRASLEVAPCSLLAARAASMASAPAARRAILMRADGTGANAAADEARAATRKSFILIVELLG